MKTFVVSKDETYSGIMNFLPVNMYNTHYDALKACASESDGSKCLITDIHMSTGHQSISHIRHEIETLSNASDVVILSSDTINSYVVSSIIANKILKTNSVEDFCDKEPLNCQRYERTQMEDCKGTGLFQYCQRSFSDT